MIHRPWAGHPVRAAAGAGRRRAPQPRHAQGAAGQAPAHPGDAAQVGQGGRDHLDARVGVVDPVHRDLVDAQPGPLGQHQQLGVEEPAGVPGQRQQQPRLVGPDRLEAALRVGEARAQGGVQQHVVAPGDQLAARPADHPGAAGQPGADGQVAVPGQQRRHQRQQRVQVGGQVHVHVGQHVGVGWPTRRCAARGRGRAAPAARSRTPSQFRGQRLRGRPGAGRCCRCRRS